MMHCTICDPKSKYENCICNKNFSEFYDIYNSIKFKDSDFLKPIKQWAISTMTLCCNYNSCINLERYKELYDIKPNNKNFYNAISVYIGVKYQSKNKVSIKIFKNGKVQLAGVTNIISAAYAVRKMFKRLVKNDLFIDHLNCNITDLRICMINSDFKIDKNIRQSEFCKIIDLEPEKYSIIRYSFNPSKYPGINIKFKHSEELTTCAVFRPGSIMITGGNQIKNYKTIIETLSEILQNNNKILY